MSHKTPMIGLKFNKLTVLEEAGNHNGKRKKLQYKCICDCGNVIIVIGENLRSNNTMSCGCENHKELNRFEDLTGYKIGELIVLSFIKKIRANSYIWKVFCYICENSIELSSKQIKSGTYLSCGCLSKTTELKKVSEYKAWTRIKQRIFDKSHKYYNYYGGAGISMFSDWVNDFKLFYDYLQTLDETIDEFEKRTGGKATIDRINCDGNYEPGNIRIASFQTQARNRKNNTVNEEIVKQIRFDREVNKR